MLRTLLSFALFQFAAAGAGDTIKSWATDAGNWFLDLQLAIQIIIGVSGFIFLCLLVFACGLLCGRGCGRRRPTKGASDPTLGTGPTTGTETEDLEAACHRAEKLAEYEERERGYTEREKKRAQRQKIEEEERRIRESRKAVEREAELLREARLAAEREQELLDQHQQVSVEGVAVVETCPPEHEGVAPTYSAEVIPEGTGRHPLEFKDQCQSVAQAPDSVPVVQADVVL